MDDSSYWAPFLKPKSAPQLRVAAPPPPQPWPTVPLDLNSDHEAVLQGIVSDLTGAAADAADADLSSKKRRMRQNARRQKQEQIWREHHGVQSDTSSDHDISRRCTPAASKARSSMGEAPESKRPQVPQPHPKRFPENMKEIQSPILECRMPKMHRWRHERNADVQRKVRGMVKKWKEEARGTTNTWWSQYKDTVTKEVDDSAAGDMWACRARAKVGELLHDRDLGDMRPVYDVQTQAGWDELMSQRLGPNCGAKLRDFTGVGGLENPFVSGGTNWGTVTSRPGDKFDFYFADFDINFHPWLQGKDPVREGCWLQWHGTSFYGAMAALSSNYMLKGEISKIKTAVEEKKMELKNFEVTFGRGLYTSWDLGKAAAFAVPQAFDEKIPAQEALKIYESSTYMTDWIRRGWDIYRCPAALRFVLLDRAI